MGVRRNFSRGVNVDILFIIFNLLRISVPSKIILHWANICCSEHGILGLIKWIFQWMTNFVNSVINIQSYQNTNKLHVSFKWLLVFEAVSIALKCCKCARMRFHCATVLASWIFAHLRVDGTLLTMQCEWTFTKRFILSALQRKCPVYGNKHKKRFVSSSSQVY